MLAANNLEAGSSSPEVGVGWGLAAFWQGALSHTATSPQINLSQQPYGQPTRFKSSNGIGGLPVPFIFAL